MGRLASGGSERGLTRLLCRGDTARVPSPPLAARIGTAHGRVGTSPGKERERRGGLQPHGLRCLPKNAGGHPTAQVRLHGGRLCPSKRGWDPDTGLAKKPRVWFETCFCALRRRQQHQCPQ